jgi:hypothetical protein
MRGKINLRQSVRNKKSGDEGARTPDLGVANAALSQLSYIPEFFFVISN